MKHQNKKPISIDSEHIKTGKIRPGFLILIFITCFFIGAIGWAQSELFSDAIEPWDSGPSMVLNQSLFCLTSLLIGLKAGLWKMLFSIVCMYNGQLCYIWFFGSDDHRDWIILCSITTTVLFLLPLVSGSIGTVVHFVRLHEITLIKRKV